MRLLKFRAWESGKMYYQARCGGEFDGIPTAPTVWNEEQGDWLNLTGQPHTKIMQYTGLKDRNGKEIYEGDIYKNPLGSNMKIIYDISGASFVGESIRTGTKLPLLNFKGFLNGEVVGNVYENPQTT